MPYTTTTATATATKFLPEDLWILILSFLPVKFILRFRCVSKSWNDLIKTSEFISSHFNRYTLRSSSETPLHLLLYREDEDEYEPLEFVDDDDHLHQEQEQRDVFKLLSENNNKSLKPYISMVHPYMDHFIIGSCHGLIGLCPRKIEGSYMIWNPLIQKSITLPSPHFIEKEQDCNPVLGFGYDSLSNDFKVIRIMRYRTQNRFQIYSIRTRSWKILNPTFPDFVFDSGIHRPVFLNQRVHWLGRGFIPCHEIGVLSNDSLILWFNFSTEEFGTIMLPNNQNFNVSKKFMHLFMGSMALVCENGDLWVMKVYGDVDSWVKELNLKIAGTNFKGLKVLGFLSYGDVLYRDDCRIILIDHLTDRARGIDRMRFTNKPWNLSYHYYFCIHSLHVESLVLLDEPNYEQV